MNRKKVRTLEVLLEADKSEDGTMHGFSRNYIRFEHPYRSAELSESGSRA